MESHKTRLKSPLKSHGKVRNSLETPSSRTQLELQWPSNYERFVKLGARVYVYDICVICRILLEASWMARPSRGASETPLEGREGLRRFSDWVASDFAPQHHAFQPLELADVRRRGVLMRSNMCHDFVTDSLWFLYKQGIRLEPEDHVFRDHIIMWPARNEIYCIYR